MQLPVSYIIKGDNYTNLKAKYDTVTELLKLYGHYVKQYIYVKLF